MSISIFSLSCPISDRCFEPFHGLLGKHAHGLCVVLGWVPDFVKVRPPPALATRNCIRIGSYSYVLQWFPNFIRSTALPPAVLASADTGRRVFTGSEALTDVVLRPG
jgi:hypothetical protein